MQIHWPRGNSHCSQTDDAWRGLWGTEDVHTVCLPLKAAMNMWIFTSDDWFWKRSVMQQKGNSGCNQKQTYIWKEIHYYVRCTSQQLLFSDDFSTSIQKKVIHLECLKRRYSLIRWIPNKMKIQQGTNPSNIILFSSTGIQTGGSFIYQSFQEGFGVTSWWRYLLTQILTKIWKRSLYMMEFEWIYRCSFRFGKLKVMIYILTVAELIKSGWSGNQVNESFSVHSSSFDHKDYWHDGRSWDPLRVLNRW